MVGSRVLESRVLVLESSGSDLLLVEGEKVPVRRNSRRARRREREESVDAAL